MNAIIALLIIRIADTPGFVWSTLSPKLISA